MTEMVVLVWNNTWPDSTSTFENISTYTFVYIVTKLDIVLYNAIYYGIKNVCYALKLITVQENTLL
jgi:hypothetical protein